MKWLCRDKKGYAKMSAPTRGPWIEIQTLLTPIMDNM